MCVDCTLMIPAELKCGCHYSPGMVQDNSWRTHPYKQAPAAETAQFSSSSKLFVLNLLLQYIQFVFALIVKVFGWLVTRCGSRGHIVTQPSLVSGYTLSLTHCATQDQCLEEKP